MLSTGGIHAVGRFLDRFGPQGADARLAGLCDEGEESVLRSGLERAGLGSGLSRADLERLGFFVCVADLEDELVRAVGPEGVETVIADEGELGRPPHVPEAAREARPLARGAALAVHVEPEDPVRAAPRRGTRPRPRSACARRRARAPRRDQASRLTLGRNRRCEPARSGASSLRVTREDGRDRPRRRRARRARALRRPSGSSTPARCGASATARSAAARRWRNEPSKRDCFRAGSSRVPREGHSPASGQSSQRGIRARHTVAPRSISACAAAPVKPCPVRRSTRSTLTSRGRTFSSKAKFAMAAAVYGPTPGSSVRSSGQPPAATRDAARWSATARRL